MVGAADAAERRQRTRCAAAPPPTGPRNCHDVTSYPAMHLLAGACGSYGLLVDISNPEKPVRLDAAADTNFSLWHTAVFSNDGSKVVFTDEWGGGTSPNCQATQHDGDGRQHDPHHRRRQEVHRARVLQDSDGAERAGELRVAQRRTRSGAGPRHHGAGLVSGRRRRERLHRSRSSVRDRVLRSRTGRSAARRLGDSGRAAGAVQPAQPRNDRRLVGRVLLERLRSTRPSWLAASTFSSCCRATSSRRTSSPRRSS